MYLEEWQGNEVAMKAGGRSSVEGKVGGDEGIECLEAAEDRQRTGRTLTRERARRGDRREFLRHFGAVSLVLGGLGVGLSGCSGAVLPVGSRPNDLFRRPPKVVRLGAVEEIAEHLISALDFLDLDRDGVHEFAEDFVKYRDAKKLETSILFVRLEERFLLSSSFFEAAMDENVVVTYQSFYDPHLRPCGSPLAEFDV